MTIQTAPPGAAPPGSAEAADQADHITPWQNCYCSTQLLGGESRFVLSTSGHIAALINPPGSPKASYQAAKTNPASPADWLKTAQSEQGSWWPDLLAWLGDRCGRGQASTSRTRRRRATAARRGARHLRLRQLTRSKACIPASAILLAPTTSTSRTS